VKFEILLTQPYPQNNLNGSGRFNDQDEPNDQDGSGGPNDPNRSSRPGDLHLLGGPNNL